MAARDPIDAVGQDEAQPRRAGDPREERGKRARPGIGVVQVLEDEQDRLALAGPFEQAAASKSQAVRSLTTARL